MRRVIAWADRLFYACRVPVQSPAFLILVAAIYATAASLYLPALQDGLWDSSQNALGHDFVNIWTAAKLMLSNTDISVIFQPVQFHAAQEALFQHEFSFHSWSYPPHLLLLIWPLGFLPYVGALSIWTLLGLAAYLFALWPKKESATPYLPLLLLAPSTFGNILEGQNGFFTAAFLVGGLRLVERKPFVGGLLLGLLTVKPHLALLVPFALLAMRNVKALSGFVLSAATLVGLSLLAFGPAAWEGFLANVMPHQISILDTKPIYTFHAMMPTTFGSLRLMGASPLFALMANVVVSLLVLGSILVVFKNKAIPHPIKVAALCTGALLATPYALTYDMTLSSAAIILLLTATTEGFSRANKALISAVWLLPGLVFWLNYYRFQISPIILGAFFAYLAFAVPKKKLPQN